MRNIYVTASDIDFSLYIRDAFTYLALNTDFLDATAEGQELAICTVTNATCKTNSIIRGYTVNDHMEYLMKIVKVSYIEPIGDPDVYYVYYKATNQVY